MFPSTNHFGQPSSSPFGTQSVFQQPNHTSNKTFVSNTFGSDKTFSSDAGNSMFGGISTGVSSATQSSLFHSSTGPFGAFTAPAFGISGSGFGVASTPFGSSSSASGGQKARFGGFGSTQSSLFGNEKQPRQPAIESSSFVTSMASVPSNWPAFGAPTTSTFVGTGMALGRGSNTPSFGNYSNHGFSSTPASGVSSSPSLSFGSSLAFGQPTSTPGSSLNIGAKPFPFAFQTGFQASTKTSEVPWFGESTFRNQSGGSCVTPYKPTIEEDIVKGKRSSLKIHSIAAMPAYHDRSHEELRREDYQSAGKGGSKPFIESASAINFGTSSAIASSTLGQSSSFSTTTTFQSFPLKPFGSTGFGPTSSVSPSVSLTSSVTNSLFGPTLAPALSPNLSPSLSLKSTSPAPAFTSQSLGITTHNYGYTTQSFPLFSSTAPSFAQTISPFGQTTASIGQTTSPTNQTCVQPFGQTNTFSYFFGSMPSLSTPFQSNQTPHTSCTFNLINCSKTKEADTSAFPSAQKIVQSNLVNASTGQGSIMQPIPVTNPFGTLPVAPQMSIGQIGRGLSIQYGISSMPVANKLAPIRASSLLTFRQLSRRPLRVPVRRYHSSADRPKVPFFGEGELSTPKADKYIITRENPRALVICPIEQWPSRMHGEIRSPSKDVSRLIHANEHPTEDCLHRAISIKEGEKANDVPDDYPVQEGGLFNTLKANQFHATTISYEQGDDIEASMPKLPLLDYYTEPAIQELAIKEKAEPGFCSHVKDFVVGRHGYGSINFLCDVDVRGLDLESIVQFNNREVIVYLDESKKPPVGQGLNKPAVVTLLNIKCVRKKTGQQYTEGPNTEKFKEMLKKKAKDQGADFVSYDPLKSEWKFRVDHF